MNCPNCGSEIAKVADACPKCGNPLMTERPWDKKRKKGAQPKEEASSHAPGDSAVQQKVKRVTEFKKSLPRDARAKGIVDEETYLDHDFIVNVGYCGFTENPEKPQDLTAGTLILTKRAVLFGDSEYKIKCGRFKLEIPIEMIDYFSEVYIGGKNMIMLHTVHGQTFYIFVRKKREWLKYFGFVLKYVPGEEAVGEEEKKGISAKRWLKTAIYAVMALLCFLFAFHFALIVFMKILFILFGAGFGLLAVVTAFVKKK